MKKTYIKPQTQAVNLFAEEALLTLSGGITVDKNNTTDTQLSNGKGWNSDIWSATDDED